MTSYRNFLGRYSLDLNIYTMKRVKDQCKFHALLAKQLVHFDSGTPTFSLTSLTNTCVRHLHQNAPSSMVGEDTCRVRPSVDFQDYFSEKKFFVTKLNEITTLGSFLLQPSAIEPSFVPILKVILELQPPSECSLFYYI